MAATGAAGFLHVVPRTRREEPSVTIRILSTLALLALLAALLTGCGSSGSSAEGVASVGDAATAGDEAQVVEEDAEAVALEWARCMRAEGVDVPDPQVEDGRVTIRPGAAGGALREGNRERFAAASEVCGTPFGDAGAPELSEENRAELEETLLAFARCMRENGVDMPDPDLSGGGGPFGFGGARSGVDPDDPSFQRAQEACQPLLQELGGRGGEGQES
jgi:hypothetical protein